MYTPFKHAVEGVSAHIEPLAIASPVLLESPHHSFFMPPNARNFSTDSPEKSGMIDMYMGELIASLSDITPVFLSRISRHYVDLNRSADCINPERIDGPITDLDIDRSNKYANGDIWLVPTIRYPDMGGPLPLPNEGDIKERLKVWRRYHSKLSEKITELHTGFGQSLHLSMHSFPGALMRERKALKGTDIIIGSLRGQTADPTITQAVRDYFEKAGFRVEVDFIFAGDECIRQHGAPEEGRHSLQIEIERELYMDNYSYQRKPDGLMQLTNVLRPVIESISEFMLDYVQTKKPAQTYAQEPYPYPRAAE